MLHADILLTTLNASYRHAAFGLRYLQANMGELQSRCAMVEFTIKQRTLEIVEAILRRAPKIVGMGIYIWNARESLAVVRMLKRLRPEMIVVLGGPEVSYETESQEIVQAADYTITGEADLAFAALCRQLLNGAAPATKIIAAALPHFEQLVLPYAEYTEEDVANRVVYVEASRGCPFTCEFCLSSLEIPVRAVPLARLLPELESLIQRGLRQFKFVDRTFNLNLQTSQRLLEFFLDHWREGMFLHFEMIPDRLPEGLRELIQKFPAGSLQFEVGIQTFNEGASKNISRRNNHVRTVENLTFLRAATGVHVHADLIVGLPGEDMESFGAGFDRLFAMRPQEIQVGMLKRLRGTPIIRHDATHGMIYSEEPPYEILQNNLISFEQMQQLRRFAKHWDLVANSGNFLETLRLLFRDVPSPFERFLRFSGYLHRELGCVEGIALMRLSRALFDYLPESAAVSAVESAMSIWRDYQRGRVSDRPPAWLARHLDGQEIGDPVTDRRSGLPIRQLRHQG